jgi:hypothetical protein
MRSPLGLMLPLITHPALCSCVHGEAQHATASATMIVRPTVRILVFPAVLRLQRGRPAALTRNGSCRWRRVKLSLCGTCCFAPNICSSLPGGLGSSRVCRESANQAHDGRASAFGAGAPKAKRHGPYPFRRAPAEQALTQGHRGLQPRRMGSKPCAGRTQCQSLAQTTGCRHHRGPRRNSSVMPFPSKRHELTSLFNCEP